MSFAFVLEESESLVSRTRSHTFVAPSKRPEDDAIVTEFRAQGIVLDKGRLDWIGSDQVESNRRLSLG